jgi:hypothetical protein
MIKKCHKQDEFVQRIEGALNTRMGNVSCKIVNKSGMADVMAKAGWSRNESAGVVGFQVDENVYVLDSAPWTVLHELVHRAGVNSDRISRFVAEGLTEAIAAELKQSPDEHRATYPAEVTWVTQRLLPTLNMSAVELGRVIVHSRNPPRAVAELMAKAKPGANVSTLTRQLRPQASNQPSFNRGGHVTRLHGSAFAVDSSVSDGVGWILLLAGFALVGPSLFR